MILNGIVQIAFQVVTDKAYIIPIGTEISLHLTDPLAGGWTAKTEHHTFLMNGQRIRSCIEIYK